jgi:hypothetical protein
VLTITLSVHTGGLNVNKVIVTTLPSVAELPADGFCEATVPLLEELALTVVVFVETLNPALCRLEVAVAWLCDTTLGTVTEGTT